MLNAHIVERFTSSSKARRILAAGSPRCYAAFFCCALTAAHLARCAAAILFLPAAEIVCLAEADPTNFATNVGCDCFRTLAHRAFCASAILRLEATDIIRIGWAVLLGAAAPASFKDSIPEIIWSNFSISNCAWLRFSRSSRSAFSKFDIVTPSGILMRLIV
jgi:hypothetical protein